MYRWLKRQRACRGSHVRHLVYTPARGRNQAGCLRTVDQELEGLSAARSREALETTLASIGRRAVQLEELHSIPSEAPRATVVTGSDDGDVFDARIQWSRERRTRIGEHSHLGEDRALGRDTLGGPRSFRVGHEDIACSTTFARFSGKTVSSVMRSSARVHQRYPETERRSTSVQPSVLGSKRSTRAR
jgi:hypothetical protein